MNKLAAILSSLLLFFAFALFANSAYAATTDRVIIKFHPSIPTSARDAAISQLPVFKKEALRLKDTIVINVPKGQANVITQQLAKNPNIEYTEQDKVAKAMDIPNDPMYSNQWGLTKILAPTAWNITHGSTGTEIAIVDTGIDGSHPDLIGKIDKRANFTTDPDEDNNGHGSHVAGIAAADTNNGIGVAGTAYDTHLMSVKALDSTGSGYYSWIADGIMWAADNGAKVINMSLGGSAASATLQNAVTYAQNKGVVVVAAAGNNGNSLPFYPADYPNVLSVAATDSNDHKPSWSDYGSWVTLAAPGVSILSAYQGGYAYLSGTSMATPFVSGVAGLVWSQHPTWTATQVISKIENTADKISGTGAYWKYGRVDACAAVDCNTVNTTPTPTSSTPPIPTATPTVTPTPTVIPTATPTPTGTATPTIAPTLTPVPTPTPTPSSKPWYCAYIPWYPGCQ